MHIEYSSYPSDIPVGGEDRFSPSIDPSSCDGVFPNFLPSILSIYMISFKLVTPHNPTIYQLVN